MASLAGVVLVAQPPLVLRLLGLGPAAEQQEWSSDRLAGVVLGVAGALLASLAYVTIRVIGQCVGWVASSARQLCAGLAVALLVACPVALRPGTGRIGCPSSLACAAVLFPPLGAGVPRA